MKNPIHDFSSGDDVPNIVNAVIEIQKGSSGKWEVDPETGKLKLDRKLSGKMHYLGDYGFIPKTLWYDSDPIDILILTEKARKQLSIEQARVIGVLSMVDDHERDDKILAVYDDESEYSNFKDIKDIPKNTIKELKEFFNTYKKLQGMKCKVLEILDKQTAYNDIELARKMYEKNENNIS